MGLIVHVFRMFAMAKEKVVLLGSKAALNTAISNDKTKKRYSLLAERLKGDIIN